MKSISKFLLVGAVAVMAIAVSAVPSEAKKMKKAKGPAPGTYWGQTCTAPGSKVMVWGHDKKWYPGVWQTCAAPFCPPACK
jgi:hypothetical protein